jgi:hypothetical protein
LLIDLCFKKQCIEYENNREMVYDMPALIIVAGP